MSKHPLVVRAALAGALAVAVAVLTAQLAGSSQRANKGPAPTSQCCISPSPVTPEVEAAQQKNDDAFFAKRAAWITAFAKTSFDPGSLPRGEIAASSSPGPATFQEATSKSYAIFEGTVESLHFTPDGTFAEVRPVSVDKGALDAGKIVSVQVGIQLEPNPDFTGAILGVNPGSLVLLPGDRALFLAGQDPVTGVLYAETGYQAFAETDAGTIESPDGSAVFSKQIDGKTLAEAK